jgi:hypothetical protein
VTRVAFWNLERFSVEVVRGANVSQGGFMVAAGAAAAAGRLQVLAGLMSAVQPDVVVLTGFDAAGSLTLGQGQLLRGPGLEGLRLVLAELRGVQPSWAMTPPIRSAADDAVAMLYRADKMIFAGPYGWSGGIGGISVDASGTLPLDYPPSFAGFLPKDRRVPEQARTNPGRLEARLALQATGMTLSGRSGEFPREFFAPGADVRAPVQGSFAEIGAGDAFTRMLHIIAARSPESAAEAATYNAWLAELDALGAPLTDPDASLLVGSFGQNVYEFATGELGAPFARLAERGYVDGFVPTPPAAGKKELRGFYATRLRPAENGVRYYSTISDQLLYPAYGYADNYDSPFSVDNAFLRASAGGTGFTILNVAVGAPYNAVENWPPGGTFIGTMPLPLIVSTLGERVRVRPTRTDINWTDWFLSDPQYRKLPAISHHMPIAIDV